MSVNDLHQFIAILEADRELHRVTAEVDPVLEIAAITDRVCKQPGCGTALLFEQPTGSDFPVATNLFGSEQRVCRALGIADLGELTVRLSALLAPIPALESGSLDRRIAALPEFSRFAPHAADEPDPSLTAMNPPDLGRFPFLQSWPGDGAAAGHPRYLTLPQVFTVDPECGTQNCGMYRVQLRGDRELAIQWKTGSGAARHADQYRKTGKPMPVAIVLGGAPALLFSAMFPLPGDLDEMTFAGFLRGAPLATAPCRSIPLRVPCGAEVVIEGYVEPGENVNEGPFGNHTGFYAPVAPAALMRVTAISHRPDAVIPATVVGPPPMEDCWMAKAWERLLVAFLKKLVPAISDIHFPLEWIFHQSAIISLENPQPGMVREIAGKLWGTPWFSAARLLIFVDAAGQAANETGTAWRCINLIEYAHDIYHDTTQQRLALDATGRRQTRRPLCADPAMKLHVLQRWQEYGIPLK